MFAEGAEMPADMVDHRRCYSVGRRNWLEHPQHVRAPRIDFVHSCADIERAAQPHASVARSASTL